MRISKKNISSKTIYDHITNYDIYRFYFGDFKIGVKCLNHLRGDRSNPSFVIRMDHGSLVHIDFADQYWRGHAINLVQQIYNCSFTDALNKIASDFKITDSSFNLEPIVKWEQPQIKESERAVIKASVNRKFTSEELKYWNMYHISEDDLKKEGIVYSPNQIYINGNRVSTYNELTFLYKFGSYFKIYKPYEKDKDKKWKSNCPNTLMYGLDNIKNCKQADVVKSVKDYHVWKKFINECTAGTQNESPTSITSENIEYLKSNSTEQYVIFDNDSAGVTSCKYYNSFGFNYWNVPNMYKPCKDPSDVVKDYSPEFLITLVNDRLHKI